LKTSGVTWAEGKFPHPKGVVEVKWHVGNDKVVYDYIKVPDGVRAKY